MSNFESIALPDLLRILLNWPTLGILFFITFTLFKRPREAALRCLEALPDLIRRIRSARAGSFEVSADPAATPAEVGESADPTPISLPPPAESSPPPPHDKSEGSDRNWQPFDDFWTATGEDDLTDLDEKYKALRDSGLLLDPDPIVERFYYKAVVRTAPLIALDRFRRNPAPELAYALARHEISLGAYDAAKKFAQSGLAASNEIGIFHEGHTIYKDIAVLTNQTNDEKKRLTALLDNTTDTHERNSILEILADLLHDTGERFAGLVALTLALRTDPKNGPLRFKLAFRSASDPGTALLALHHYRYLRISNYEARTVANNLGNLYGELELPASKVRLLKEATKKGLHLSKLNLAKHFIQSGFLDEAEELNTQLRSEDPTAVVTTDLTREIRAKETSERQRVDALQRRATSLDELISDSALDAENNLSDNLGSSVYGAWSSSAGWRLSISSKNGKKLEGDATYTRKLAIARFLVYGASSRTEQEAFLIEGVGIGSSIYLNIAVPGSGATLLSGAPTVVGYMFLRMSDGRLKGVYWKGSEELQNLEFAREETAAQA